MKKHWLKALLLTTTCILLIFSVFSGCNVAGDDASETQASTSTEVTDEATSSQDEATSSQEPVTLNVLSQRVEDGPYYDAIKEGFEAENPNITLQIDLIPTAEYPTVLQTRIATDSVDLCVFTPPNDAARTTWFLDLADQPFLDYVYSENIEELVNPIVDPEGAIWSVPTIGTTFVTFYNKDMFSDNGISVPTTWDEFTKACDDLMAAGITPIAFGGMDQWPVNCIFDAFGPPLVQAIKPGFFETLNTGETKFTDPEFVSVLERMNIMFQNYTDRNSLGIAYSDVPGMFAQGQVAMLIDGNWTAAQIEAANPEFEVGVFLTPSSDNEEYNKTATVRNGMSWSIPINTPHQEEALLLLEYILRPENQEMACDIAACVPVGPNVTVEDMLTNESSNLIDNSLLKVPVFEGEVAKYTPGSTYAFTPYLIQMFAGELTPEQVAQQLQDDFDESKPDWIITVE